ncbi:MAG: primosomal protein N', partial [Gammaproteobacteria bacterium]
MPRSCIFRVAVNTPLRRVFDYLPPLGSDNFRFVPGQRVLVPFGGNRSCVSLLIATADTTTVPTHKLKHVLQMLDDAPLFGPEHLGFLLWAAHYYHHPPGEVVLGCLPKLLRNGSRVARKFISNWRLTPAGKAVDLHTLE